jgi:cytochrome c-type biogenesis protein CcmH
MIKRRPLLLLLTVVALVGAVWSYILITAPPQETLDQRVYDVASQLKCPVCQSESVANSSATIAQQMRGVIRQQLQEGKSEQEVLQYFASRYGEQILWSPPQRGFSLLAWLVPIGMLFIGASLLFFILRDWQMKGHKAPGTGEAELAQIDEAELKQYRQRLERELAEEDALFSQSSGEAG